MLIRQLHYSGVLNIGLSLKLHVYGNECAGLMKSVCFYVIKSVCLTARLCGMTSELQGEESVLSS